MSRISHPRVKFLKQPPFLPGKRIRNLEVLKSPLASVQLYFKLAPRAWAALHVARVMRSSEWFIQSGEIADKKTKKEEI